MSLISPFLSLFLLALICDNRLKHFHCSSSATHFSALIAQSTPSFIMFFFSTLFLSCFALFSTTGWASYVLQDDYFAQGFFDQFDFFDQADPTNGFVSYKTYDAANAAGLIHNSSGQAYMGVDSENVTPYGRNSVRITSKKSYNSGLVIVDIAHMPGGICGTWYDIISIISHKYHC